MTERNEVADAIRAAFVSESEEYGDYPVNVVDALFAISRALNGVARELRDIGFGDAAGSPHYGALEGLAMKILDGANEIAEKIGYVAEEIGKDNDNK